MKSSDLFYFRAITILDRSCCLRICNWLKPDFTKAYNLRGLSKDKIGQHEEAIADYSKAIRQNSDYAEAYKTGVFHIACLSIHSQALESDFAHGNCYSS